MSKFTNQLKIWYRENQRDLPWRKTKDPYKIWLSEVILQQTRVAQGLPYYKVFIKTFPTVYDLANASQEQVLKLWQGLGYYSRARNLHFAAQTVVNEYNGVFPKTFKELKKLKGVGDYTAAAIASFSYNEPVAVVDGNVYRVLSRYLGLDTPINSTEGKKIFKEKANGLLDQKKPGNFNQAIMEFGALHCKPKKPLCVSCLFQKNCVAFQQGKVKELPVKLKKIKVRKRYLNYLVFQSTHQKTFIQQRKGKGIWQNLYQFPLVESPKIITKKELMTHPLLKNSTVKKESVKLYNRKVIKHQLSHQTLFVRFWLVTVPELPEFEELNEFKEISWTAVERFPVPVIIEKFLKDFD